MTLWVHSAAARHPDRVAVETPERAITYSQLARAAEEAMRGLGAEHGPVAVALEPGVSWVIALHACLLAGRPIQPIDLRLSGEEQATRHEGSGTLIDDELPRRGTWIRRAAPSSDAVAAVLHTSGTTAAPKPVPLTYGNFMASALGSAAVLGLDLDERWLCPMPLTHVGGLSIPIRSAIYGTTAVLPGRFDAEVVMRELMDPARRITLVSLVPTMLARLLDAGLERPPTLRWALLGGGPIAPALLDRARLAGVPVAPSYGMTEACSQIATFGWPLPGLELRLQGPEGAREILVRGAMVSPAALAPDGWLYTGDLGEFDERGALAITARQADTIVSGGENVAPAEVEAVLAEHPDVAEAAVFGRPDPEWGEALVAAIVPRAGSELDPEELRAFCRERLAGFKVPKSYEAVAALPRTPSGKLLRRELGVRSTNFGS